MPSCLFLGYVFQMQQEGRQLETLDGCSRDCFLFPIRHEKPWCVVMDDTLHFTVKLTALGLIGRGSSLLQKLIHFGVGIVTGIETTLVRQRITAQRQIGTVSGSLVIQAISAISALPSSPGLTRPRNVFHS